MPPLPELAPPALPPPATPAWWAPPAGAPGEPPAREAAISGAAAGDPGEVGPTRSVASNPSPAVHKVQGLGIFTSACFLLGWQCRLLGSPPWPPQ